MYSAYTMQQENEAWLGYYTYDYSTMNCCDALPEVGRTYDYSRQDNPLDGPRGAACTSILAKEVWK